MKALWEELIDSGRLGYMALLRNLRNILQANVSPAHIEQVAGYICDPVKVAKSKQLPFRFLTAYKELMDVTSVHTATMLSALEKAVRESVNNLEMKSREGEVGYSTNGYLVIDYLIANDIKIDKVMMFTDMQMWDSRRGDSHIQKIWEQYRQKYPESKLYLFDLSGYGNTPVELTKDNAVLVSGWSDKVFDVLKAIENGEDAIAQINKVEI